MTARRPAILAILAACTPSQPAPPTPTQTTAEGDAEVAAAPTAAPIEPAPVEPVRPTPEPSQPPAAEPPAIAPPDPAHTFDPSLSRAIWPADPDAIDIVDAVSHRGERVVLYRFLGAVAWRGERRRAGTLDRELNELEDVLARCDPEAVADMTEEQACQCELFAAPDAFVAAEDPEDPPFVWEVARLVRDDGNLRVAARKRLSDVTLDPEVPEVPLKFSAADLDADGEPELTVVVPFLAVDCDEFTEHRGSVGYLLEWSDLRELLAVARHDVDDYTHNEGTKHTLEARWLIKDQTGDGHPDLRIRETARHQFGERSEHEARTLVCPWDQATDGWTCPERPRAATWSPTSDDKPPCLELRLGSYAECRTIPPVPKPTEE